MSDSRESTPSSISDDIIPISLSDVEDIQTNTVSDDTILRLLQKELDLQLEMEAVQAQITKLEHDCNKEEEEDDNGSTFDQ